MNPLLLDFPNSFETERLIIRAPRIGDGAALNAAILESWAELKPWMPWAQEEPSLEESETNIRKACTSWILRTDLRLMVLDKTGSLLGSSGLHRINWEIPRFEIGYWLRTSAWGQGLMAEAVIGIADFAFGELNARRVEIRCDAGNERSIAVAQRAGFRLESTLKNWARSMDGTLCDTHVFVRSKGDEA